MPVLIIGGVTAAGKTSIAKKLKEIYHWDYIEADEFHSSENINKMKAGIALTDADRLPWLKCLHEKFEHYSSLNQSCIITCSALKKIYRQILLTGSAESDMRVELPKKGVYMIVLVLSRETLYERLLQRQHQHFMSPTLLDSQLQTLELPTNETDEPYTSIINCDSLSTDEIIHQIKKIVNQ